MDREPQRSQASVEGKEVVPPKAAAWVRVRPDQVARAKALLLDKDYPSKAVLKSVAELLAKHLDGR